MTHTKTEQIEINTFARELNLAWRAFVDSTDSNFTSAKGHFLAVLSALDGVDEEMRRAVYAKWVV